MIRACGLAGVAAALLAAAPLHAQAPAAGREDSAARASSALLPPHHWALDALHRADGLGLLRGAPGAESSVPIHSAGAALARAARLAPEVAPAAAPLVRAITSNFMLAAAGPFGFRLNIR